MSEIFRLTDLRTQLLVMSQEQLAQTRSLGEMRLTLDAISRKMQALEDRLATLEAAQRTHITGGIQGLDGCITVTMPPEWGESVPLVEICDSVGNGRDSE